MSRLDSKGLDELTARLRKRLPGDQDLAALLAELNQLRMDAPVFLAAPPMPVDENGAGIASPEQVKAAVEMLRLALGDEESELDHLEEWHDDIVAELAPWVACFGVKCVRQAKPGLIEAIRKTLMEIPIALGDPDRTRIRKAALWDAYCAITRLLG